MELAPRKKEGKGKASLHSALRTTGFLAREITMVSPRSTSCRRDETWPFALFVAKAFTATTSNTASPSQPTSAPLPFVIGLIVASMWLAMQAPATNPQAAAWIAPAKRANGCQKRDAGQPSAFKRGLQTSDSSSSFLAACGLVTLRGVCLRGFIAHGR